MRSRIIVVRTLEAALAAMLLSACSGGGGSSIPNPSGNQQNAPATLSAYPISNSRVVLSPTGGFTGAVALPNVSSGTGAMVTIADQTTAPAGLVALNSSARRTKAGSNVPIFYIAFTPDRDAVLTAYPGFEIDLPQPPAAGATYYVAAYGANQWSLGIEGPATVSGSALTFAAAPGPVGWSANKTYWFGVYAASAAVAPVASPTASAAPAVNPTATPAPSPSPSPSPTPTPLSNLAACSRVTTISGQSYTAARIGGGDKIDVESSAYAGCDIGIYVGAASGPASLDHTVVNGPFRAAVYFDNAGPATIDHTSICFNGARDDESCNSGGGGSGSGIDLQNTPQISVDHTTIDGYAIGFAASPCPNPANNITDDHTTITNATYPWSILGGAISVNHASPIPAGVCAGSGANILP